MTEQKDHGPLEIELDDLPDLAPQTGEPTFDVDQVAETRLTRIARVQRSPLLRWTIRLIVAIALFAIGLWAWDFTVALLERSAVLGGAAVVLFSALLILVIVGVLRELAAMARINRIERLNAAALDARNSNDLVAAQGVLSRLQRLYAGRGDVAWGLSRVEELKPNIFDADGLLDLAEREIVAPLDQRALAEVEAAAVRVATVTALVPLALVDVLTALYVNVAMIRRIAEVYGGRSGSLGAWRLMRAVIGHIAATGVIAIGDDLIGSTISGGVLSKLSRRFGEGLINGALTARIGLTAMDICRPMPFKAVEKPSVAGTVRRALTGLFTSEARE